jgi:predicted permease
MSTIAQDFRLARRLLTKSPLFTTIVVATLSLAIGLNTAVFSAVDALLLRPLPGVQEPRQLVQLYRSWPGDMKYGSNSLPHFLDLRDRTGDVFSGVALWAFNPLNVAAGGEPKRVFGMMVSANYFSVLGVKATRGRLFVPQEDSGRMAHPVAVISYAAWNGLFGGDSSVVGRKVIINGGNYEIVGVAAPEFSGVLPLVTPAFWVPLSQHDQLRPGNTRAWESRGNNSYSIIARAKPGVSVAAITNRMKSLVTELRQLYPDDYKDSGITVVPQGDAGIHPLFRSAEVGMSAVVMAVVVLLLLIACVNVANLFLARARDRAREMAVRLSLGATRASLVRQLLIESLMFAGISAIVGLGIAEWAITLGNRITLPLDVNFTAGMELSPTVLVFTLVATVLSALLFGIAPALQATSPSLVPALKGEEPAGQSRSRMRSGLVVAQMALSIVLLVCAGLFLRNLKAATTADKGFVSDNVLIAELDPGMQGYPRARSEDFFRRLTQRLTAHPGVKAVGFAASVPLSLNESDSNTEIPGYVPSPNENMGVQLNVVTPGYFEAMGIPVTAGRAFLVRDDSAAQPALVVNQQFVAKYFSGRDPLGKTVHVHGKDHSIIGVVPTGKYMRLGESPTPFMYFAQAQDWDAGMVIHLRTTGAPEALIPTLRAEVAAIDPSLPLSNVKSMNQTLGIALLPARLSGVVLGIFGLLGLVMAAIGMYGVMAYSVSQRTREIGIRMAIGAATGDVVKLVMRQGLTLVLIGAGIGLAGAFAVSRVIAGVLYGSGANDPVTFVAVPLMLIGVAVLATWMPARRAAATDPLAALRQE